ncbi:MAG: hypothetical protein ABIH99_04125 [Candidatus Micrarchaeota archaeon]
MTKKSNKKPKCSRKRASELLSNKHLRQFLIELAGENSLKVAKEFTEPMSDEDLARSCKIKVSDVRAVLNKLYNEGLAAYKRTRDKESGWYSYTWYSKLDQAGNALNKKNCCEASAIQKQIDYERAYDFYGCNRCGKDTTKIPFESAVDLLFRCPGCGSHLTYINNTKEIESLEKQVRRATVRR